MPNPWSYYRADPDDEPLSSTWSQGRLWPPVALVGRLQLMMSSDVTDGISTAIDVVEMPNGDLVGLSSWCRVMENDGRAEWLRRCAHFYDEMQRCFDPFPD